MRALKAFWLAAGFAVLLTGCPSAQRPVDREVLGLTHRVCTSEMQVDLCIEEVRRWRQWEYCCGRP